MILGSNFCIILKIWNFFFLGSIYNHGSYGDADHTRREVICAMVTVSNIDESKCDEIMDQK